MVLNKLIETILLDIKRGYTNIAIERLLDNWETIISPSLDKYYKQQKKNELLAISQRYNSIKKQDSQGNLEDLTMEGNKIVHSILDHLTDIKEIASAPVSEDLENTSLEKTKPTDSGNSKEISLQNKSDNDYKRFLREWSSDYENKKIELNNLIKNQGLNARSVLYQSIDIRIKYELVPILLKRIEIESNLRRSYKIPYSEQRIEVLKLDFRETIKSKMPNIVTMGFVDAESNWIEHMGALPSYKKEELVSDRKEALNSFPVGVFDFVVENLNSDHFDILLNM